MNERLHEAREHFIQGITRIAHFWGFPRAMGAIYGAIYLSPSPLSLDDIVGQVGVSKGAVSTNVRTLERLRMVHKHLKVGDRKDYYTAETDFWRIARGILREREKSEFDRALRSVDESLQILTEIPVSEELDEAGFARQRMEGMRDFFHRLDGIVATILALDELRAEGVRKLLGRKGPHQEGD